LQGMDGSLIIVVDLDFVSPIKIRLRRQ
jgi:hypothetical protein